VKNKIGAFTKRLGKTRKRGEGAVGEKGKKKSRILLIVCGLLLLAGDYRDRDVSDAGRSERV
jgi:hypothetical protein